MRQPILKAISEAIGDIFADYQIKLEFDELSQEQLKFLSEFVDVIERNIEEYLKDRGLLK